MTAYTNPATGRQEQITDARALGTVEQRTAAAKAADARFAASVERGRRDAQARRMAFCPCAICRHS